MNTYEETKYYLERSNNLCLSRPLWHEWTGFWNHTLDLTVYREKSRGSIWERVWWKGCKRLAAIYSRNIKLLGSPFALWIRESHNGRKKQKLSSYCYYPSLSSQTYIIIHNSIGLKDLSVIMAKWMTINCRGTHMEALSWTNEIKWN